VLLPTQPSPASPPNHGYATSVIPTP
jgi:hypothetical protein